MKETCVDCGKQLFEYHTAECYALYCLNSRCLRYGLLTFAGLTKRNKYLKPLSKRQQQILDMANPFIKGDDIVKRLKIQPSSANAHIQLLIRKGYLVKEDWGLYKNISESVEKIYDP